MKSKNASRLARMGGRLGLALACMLIASQAAAVPYASQIRFAESEIVQAVGTDLLYTLNEDCDEITIEVYSTTSDTAIRTYNFTSPALETTMGRHAVSWDGRDESNNQLPLNEDELIIRINVKKQDDSTDWTPLSSNSSGTKATLKTSMFPGFSPNDVTVPTDPTTEQFGLVLATHGLTSAQPAGVVLLGTDLEPLIGSGGGANAMKGQHILPGATAFGVWNMYIDPIDPNLVWWAGQSGEHRIGVFDVSGIHPEDVQEVADVVLTTTSPRGIAIFPDSEGNRVGYMPLGTAIVRLTLDTTYPYAVLDQENITAPILIEADGWVRYAAEIKFDLDGNLYFLSRSASSPTIETEGTVWRWNKADVDAAPGVPLSEANAAWYARVPEGTVSTNTLHVDNISGEVYIAASALASNPRGIFRVGNTADESLPAKPYQMTLDNMILNYDDEVQFPVGFSGNLSGHGIATDWQGNMYTTTRNSQEIYSFSPPGNGAFHDIDTASPAGYSGVVAFDQTNRVVVDPGAVSDGIATFNSLGDALASFGPGGHNNGFPGTNRIEILAFGPYDEELPSIPVGFDDDDFEITTPNGPALVLQQSSTWNIERNTPIDGLIIAASSTNTPTGPLVSLSGGTQSITNSWILSLPSAASSYTSVGDIPAGIANGTAAHDASLVRAGNGLHIENADLVASNLIVTQQVNGVTLAGSSLDLTSSVVTANAADGISASAGDLTVSGTSNISNNLGAGVNMSGTATLTMNSTYADPNTLIGNAGAGIATSSSGTYSVRNAIIHDSGVGFDIQTGAISSELADYNLVDVIITGSSTAGIRIADSLGFSAARITLFENGIGLLDSDGRNPGDFWTIELEDTIIAGLGDIGISSSGAPENSIRAHYLALVTEGPDALAMDTDAPADALSEFDAPVLNADPEFASTSFIPHRNWPILNLAPTSPEYRDFSAEVGIGEGQGSFNGNLGGGSRWRPTFIVPVSAVFETNFETDQSGNFAIAEVVAGDNAIDFNYDYSTFSQAGGGIPESIPPSPFNTGTGTRAVRMATNIEVGAVNAITATLTTPISTQDNMRITIDAWQNSAASFGTETLSFGGSADNSFAAMSNAGYFLEPNDPFNGFFFSVSHDGGQAQDYRYYDGDGTEGVNNANNERANFLGRAAINNAADFTEIFPSPMYPIAGVPGKGWTRWELDVYEGYIRLHVTRQDGLRILMADWFKPNDGATMTGLAPHFGTQDLFASIAAPSSDQFVLIDYFRVESVEPGIPPDDPDVELGDINEDGVVNVADVTALANAVIAGTADQLDPDVADINGDGTIDFDDVAALAELIVNSAP